MKRKANSSRYQFELVVVDRALVGAEQPALEQARDPMHVWERHMSGVAGR